MVNPEAVEKIAEVAMKGLRKGKRDSGASEPPPWPAPPRRGGRSRSHERSGRGQQRDPAPAERRNFGTPPPEDDCSEARFRTWVKRQFVLQEQNMTDVHEAVDAQELSIDRIKGQIQIEQREMVRQKSSLTDLFATACVDYDMTIATIQEGGNKLHENVNELMKVAEDVKLGTLRAELDGLVAQIQQAFDQGRATDANIVGHVDGAFTKMLNEMETLRKAFDTAATGGTAAGPAPVTVPRILEEQIKAINSKVKEIDERVNSFTATSSSTSTSTSKNSPTSPPRISSRSRR